MPAEDAHLQVWWALGDLLGPSREVHPIDGAIGSAVVNRELETDNTGSVVIFNFANSEIGLQFEPLERGVRVCELTNFAAPETDSLPATDRVFMTQVDINCANVRDTHVGRLVNVVTG